MDKIMFLAALAEKLTHYPLNDEDINICVAEMSRQFEAVSDEDLAKENLSENDVAVVAEGLYNQYSAHKAAKAAEEAADKELFLGEEVQDSQASAGNAKDDTDFFEALAKETEEERRDQEKYEELRRVAIERAVAENDEMLAVLGEAESENGVNEENDPIIEAVDPEERPDIAYEEFEGENRASQDSEEKYSPEQDASEFEDDSEDGFFVDGEELKKADDDPEAIEKHRTKMKEKKEKIKGTPLFWTLFILTLPITLPVIAAISVLFAAAYIVVSAIIIALSVATVSCVALGTILALVGVIYGITQLFSTVAIGLYELGLGLAIGGVTMLVSVLLYNVAIRFAPLLYKCLFRFAKFVASKIRKLYYKIKKECGR